jgi:hypothetical protein
MTRTSRLLTSSFIVTFGLASFGRTAFAGQAEPLTITLHVHNYARVPSAVLTRAEDEATRIYRALGVDLVWVDLSAHSAYPPSENLSKFDLTINILSGVMAERKRAAGDVMGAAPGSPEKRGNLAYVFYARVARLAHGVPNDAESKILGHVMAHEMGHLLLPANSHTQSGVMDADWDSQQLLRMVKGLLQFTPEQGELIRSHVSSGHSQS